MDTKSQNSNMILAFITLLGVIAVVAIIGFFMLRQGPNIIEGQADVTQYRVSSKIPERIKAFMVEEGQQVKAGDTLAILEAPDINAKLEQAQAAESAAQAQNQKAINGARIEVKQGAFEMWQKAKAGLTIAQQTYQRIERLFTEGVVTAQKRDEAKAMLDAATATEKAAKSQYDMAVKGAQIEDKEAAKALVNRAKGAVAEVESYLKEAYLVAPTDGEVSEIFPQVGELVGSGAPIMNIAIMDKMWVTFNIREDLLKDIKIGNVIETYVPALGTKIKVKVYYMKDLGTYAAWKATKPTGQYDLKTFEVRARPLNHVEGLRPGMSVVFEK